MTPKIAVIGCGRWGMNHVRVLHKLGALAGVCDPDESRFATVPGAPRLNSFTDAVKIADGLVIATPSKTHCTLAMMALQAKKHVLVEKPMALDAGEARTMQEAAQDRGLVLMVGHILLYHPAVVELLRIADEGRLGRIKHIAAQRLNMGIARKDENALWSFAPHDLSVILKLIPDTPEMARSWGASILTGRVEDTCGMALEFPDLEVAQVSASWLSPIRRREIVVTGTKAIAVFDDTKPAGKLVVQNYAQWDGQPRLGAIMEFDGIGVEPLEAELQDFLECIETGRKPIADAESGVKVVEVLDRCS